MSDLKWKAPSTIKPGCEGHLANPVCRNLHTHCNGVPCQPPDPDGYRRLENDRIVPGAHGGTYTDPLNTGLVCASYNRKKFTKPDPFYSVRCYFDNPLNLDKLMPYQVEKGYGIVVGTCRELFEDPDIILTKWMLLAWMVGTGKTIGMLSILFGINAVRNTIHGGAVRRIKKVLWLVHQESLVSSLKRELETELTDYNICDVRPTVEVVKNKAHWKYTADIIVACPQAIWDNNSNGLSEQEITEILSNFDAIIVDEGHFAVDQYLHLSRLAPLAFKFAVTATPMDREGELFPNLGEDYANVFALFSSVWYEEGFSYGRYKEVLPYEEGLDVTYFPTVRPSQSTVRHGHGGIETGDASDSDFNFAKDKFIIEEAHRIAEQSDLVTGYHNHVMLRVDTISRAKHLVGSLQDSLPITGVWTGAKGPNLGEDRHPWMKAKQKGLNGRPHKDSKRIVVTVDIGQFGINNRYCSTVGWIAANFSLKELVQRTGRAMRSAGVDGDRIKLIWDGADERFSVHIKEALDYILNGEEKLKDAFENIATLTRGAIEVAPHPAAAHVDRSIRNGLIEGLGRDLAAGVDLVDAVENVYSAWLDKNHGASQAKQASVGRLMEVLKTEKGFATTLAKTLNFPAAIGARHPELVLKDFAAKSFPLSLLHTEVTQGRLLYAPGKSEDRGYRAQVADQLYTNTFLVDQAAAELTRLHQRSMDLDSVRIPRLHLLISGSREKFKEAGFIEQRSLAHEMLEEYGQLFVEAGKVAREFVHTTFPEFTKAVNKAGAKYFNLPSLKREEVQPFEKQLVDALTRQPAREYIKAKALFLLAEWHTDVFAGHNEIFSRLADVYESAPFEEAA
jgi:hypothetical protein